MATQVRSNGSGANGETRVGVARKLIAHYYGNPARDFSGEQFADRIVGHHKLFRKRSDATSVLAYLLASRFLAHGAEGRGTYVIANGARAASSASPATAGRQILPRQAASHDLDEELVKNVQGAEIEVLAAIAARRENPQPLSELEFCVLAAARVLARDTRRS